MTVSSFPIIDREQWLALRKPDVTASVAACLFGDAHPYLTAYQLWAQKSGLVPGDIEDSPTLRRGRLLEPVIMQMIVEDRPDWRVRSPDVYLSDREARIGATPDFYASRPDIDGLGVIQAKSVGKFAFAKGWRSGDEVEVPLWIAVQAIVEASLAGATWAAVAAMALGDGGLDLYLVDIPLKPALMERLRGVVKDFWRRVEENDPYSIDWGRDAAIVMRLYADDDGTDADLGNHPEIIDLVDRRAELKEIEAQGSSAEKERRIVDANIIAALGSAARGRLADGRIIEAKTIKRKEYVAKASSYRAIKIFGGERAAE